MTRKLILLAPLGLLLLFLATVGWRLVNPGDTVIRSRLDGQPIPAFALPPAVPTKPGLASADLARGGPRLVNIFASWCVPCIGEAPILMRLKREGVHIDGIAVRDRSVDVADFLARHGDPFERIGSDRESRVQIALGSAGVPESFIVDGRGIIRGQHIGAIAERDLPAIRRALEEAR
jgi:cytochrome c biogenesis protein CcmG/thiol:disulfide interchange protein DsbE